MYPITNAGVTSIGAQQRLLESMLADDAVGLDNLQILQMVLY